MKVRAAMWESLRRAVHETEGFYLRFPDEENTAQRLLLFFPHGVVVLLVMISSELRLHQRQIRGIEQFRDYGIPIYYAGSPRGVYSAVAAAAQNIDLGINNCYP